MIRFFVSLFTSFAYAQFYSHPHNLFEHCDHNGELSVWHQIAIEDLDFPETQDKFLLKLSPTEAQNTNSIFGEYWFCALLDSNFYFVNESEIKLTLLNGECISLFKNKKNYESKSLEWIGTFEDNKLYLNNNWKNISVTYKDNFISHYSNNRRKMVWVREAGSFKKLVVNNVDLIIVSEISGKKNIRISDTNLKINKNQIRWNENLISIKTSTSKQELYRLRYKINAVEHLIKWNPETNRILSYGNFQYLVELVDNNNKRIIQITPSGKIKSYCFDTRKSMTIFNNGDIRVEKTFFSNKGLLYNKIRSNKISFKDTLIQDQRNYYDESGTLLKTVNHLEK